MVNMTDQEADVIEKLKSMDIERGLHLLQKVLAYYTEEHQNERRRFAKDYDSVFAIIKVNKNMDSEGWRGPYFDVLAIPDRDAYEEGCHQAQAVDLADAGTCYHCDLPMRGSKHSYCPICGSHLY